MVEIIIGVWLTCLCLSTIAAGINYYMTRKKLRSPTLKILNVNLEKVGLFWSNTLGDFLPLTETSIKDDFNKSLKQAVLIGCLGIGSIPGFLLLLVLVLSIHYVARSRKQIATFSSVLSNDITLTKQEVERLVAELAQL